MGGWMASKKEIKPGDIVIYKSSGKISVDCAGKPSIIQRVETRFGRKCVIYKDGSFDYYRNVEKCPPVLEELL